MTGNLPVWRPGPLRRVCDPRAATNAAATARATPLWGQAVDQLGQRHQRPGGATAAATQLPLAVLWVDLV
ncbi:MAG: hypothetical protein ACRDSR_18240 [Pseudonocardiaceae bacterium]